MSENYEILVVDSHITVGNMLTLMAGDAFNDYSKVAYTDSLEGAKRFMHLRMFDLVFLDLFAPGKAGGRTLRIVKIFSPQIPIVVLTTCENANDALHFIAAGAECCIEKTQFTRQVLAETTQRVVSRSLLSLRAKDLVLEPALVS